MSIGEALLSNVLPVLLEKLASPVISELGKLYGVKDEIAKLRRTVERLQAMLRDAEQKKLVEGQGDMLWLQEIKTILHAAEDLVEEFEYEGLRCEVMKSNADGRRHGADGNCLVSFMSEKLCKFCSRLTPHAVSFRCQMAHKIGDLRRKLDEISKEKKYFKLDGMSGSKANLSEIDRPAETTALLGTPKVFGRDEVKNKLVELLLTTRVDAGSTPSSSSSLPVLSTNFSVISIVGMGGLGKTTLAQLVYNTKQVQDHFSIKIWVCVSPDFDLKKLTKHILEHLVDTQSNIPNRDNLNVLQQDLSEKLKGKRFLLILDDVWEMDQNKWKTFFAPLAHGERGSKVLITSRLANVADILHPKKIELKDLSFPDSWSIFETYAFGDAHSHKYQNLEPIGKKIVKKLKGVPLAVSVIGGLLGSESDERRWRNVLDSKLWEVEQGGHGILPALKLSYEFLPYHLKKCFIYCCVWPKNRHFSVYELVQLWMAQDFVRPEGNRCMEDVGVDCIKELLNRSLIQVVYGGYMIHDLLHDLGQQILEQEYYRIGPEPDQFQQLPKDAHSKIHLVASYSEAPKNMREILYEFKSLRTLEFWPGSSPYKLQIDLFHIVKGLRVFEICGSSIDALPDSIGYLKHLRYLDLSFTNIECLPETLCSLYFLQTLRLQECDKLKSLPSGMSNLVNLHYLEARTELVSNIAQIWKLIHLQYLEVFSVSEENRNRLGDLKNMRELRGRLCIQNLERVKNREAAAEATILKNMQYLKSLELQWGDGQNVNHTCNYPALSIIQFLQPPQQLKELIIKSYAGTNFPSWMNNISIPGLEHLYLHNCTNLNPFSPLGQLHSLRTLHIIGCPQLKELSQLPPALENLILQEVGLVVLSGRLHHLPLQRVILCQIPELKQLPLLPFTLRELAIEGVGLQALPELSQGCGMSTMTTTTATRGSYIDEDKSIDYLGEPALSTLKIHTCPHLTTLDGGLLKQQHLRHLKVLSIKRCRELVNWPEGGGFQSTLYSLADELSIESCPTLAEFPEGTRLSPSLKKLVVKGSPMVPNRLMLGQVHNVDDVDVDMDYSNLEQSANEALQHILVVEQLTIAYFQVDDDVGLGAESFVALTYNKESVLDFRVMEKCMARQVVLGIVQERRRRRGGGCQLAAAYGDNEKYHYDYDVNWCPPELLWRRLRGLPWTSSLRHLLLMDIPGREFMISRSGHDPHSLSPPLPSLQELFIMDCSELRRLPTEMMLSHLTGLKALKIIDCPELTWSSVDVGIHSLPSLEYLLIKRCPKLLETMPPQPPSSASPKKMVSNNSTTVGDREDVRSSPPPTGLPRLRHLQVDDLKILTPWLLVDQNMILTSLRILVLRVFELTSLTPADERALKTLAPSLQCLMFHTCPNLENLPADLRGLLPNLKCLVMSECPKLRHLPAEELPELLEVLAIHECPEMKEELANARRHKQLDLLRIPVWTIDGEYQTGSYSMLQELRAKWDFRIFLECEGTSP